MRDRFCLCGTRADIRLFTGFPKKLLVAISVVVIIAMCLGPAEAASLERRHRLHDNMSKTTKDTGASRSDAPVREHKRRHHGLRSGAQTKEHGNTKRPIDPYEKVRIKIENKMAYTKDNFDERRKALRAEEQGDYGSGMPVWLPKTNFVDIHFHRYNVSNKTEAVKSKKVFEFLIRKLYKSLLEYYELFKRFKSVEVETPDNEINRYNIKRQDIFTKTTDDLYSAIEDIKDAMTNVKMTKWQKIHATKSKLHHIELKVNGAKYLKNDDILLRAYGNLLNNWHLEFNCSRFRKSKNRKVAPQWCKQYDDNLREKRNRRKKTDRSRKKTHKLTSL